MNSVAWTRCKTHPGSVVYPRYGCLDCFRTGMGALVGMVNEHRVTQKQEKKRRSRESAARFRAERGAV